jgi:hypothetical protein
MGGGALDMINASKYFRHVKITDGVKTTICFKPDITLITSIPDDESNTDYIDMMEKIDAGTATMEEVEIT